MNNVSKITSMGMCVGCGSCNVCEHISLKENELGFPAKFSKTKELPFKTKGAVYFENQAQFNPLKFISEISHDLNIYEHTFVKEIEKNTALTDNGKITAKKIIVATHFPFINKHGSYFLKLYQHRSYVSAFKNAPEIKGMYVDENDNLIEDMDEETFTIFCEDNEIDISDLTRENENGSI